MSKIIGDFGEKLACDYLKSKGYEILDRNVYSRFGEIDIIAKNNEYIIFVEVKTRKEGAMVSGVEAVTLSKQKKIIKTAISYLLDKSYHLQPRFDIIEVNLFFRDGNYFFKSLNHLENAFCVKDEYNETF